MKKSLLVLLVVAVVAGATLASVSAVSAQGLAQGTGTAYGYGGHGAGGQGTGGYGNRGTEIEDPEVHALEVAAWSEALGIPAADIDARLAAGETMSQIAISTGMTVQDYWTLKVQIKSNVADQALAAGYVTADEAALMKQAASYGGRGITGARGAGVGTRGAGLNLDGTCVGIGAGN